MAYQGKRSLSCFIDEEKHMVLPSAHVSMETYPEICEQEVQFSPSVPSSPLITPHKLTAPSSPGSPWTVSPLRSPSPSLLYQCIASLHRHEGNIYSIAVSKGVVFTGCDSNRIRAWRKPDGMERGYLKAHCGEVRAILAYGNMLFTAHRDRRIRIWNFRVSDSLWSKKVASLPRKSSFLLFPRPNTQKHEDCVSCMAYYHAEGLLYTGSYDKKVKAWRISDNKCVDSFVAHEDIVNAILVNQDDGCVFTCSSDGSVKIWRRVYKENSHTLTMILKFQPSPINALAFVSSHNSCFLYSGSSDGTINFWEKENIFYRFNHGGFLQGHLFSVLCLVAIEKLIFSGSEDTTIRIWRREEGSYYHECLAVLDGHRGPVRCLAVSFEMEKVMMGFLVYSGSLDQTFKIWRVKVMPDETTTCLDYFDQSDARTKTMDHELSPVLSPSWVEKKLQGDNIQ